MDTGKKIAMMIWAFMCRVVRSWLEIWALLMAFGHFTAKLSVSCLETVPISIEKVRSATCSLSISFSMQAQPDPALHCVEAEMSDPSP